MDRRGLCARSLDQTTGVQITHRTYVVLCILCCVFIFYHVSNQVCEMIMEKGYAADALLRELGVRLPSDAIDVDGRHLGGQRAVLLNHPEMRKEAYNAWLKVCI